MNTQPDHSENPSPGCLISGVGASLIGTAYISLAFIYNAGGCTGTGSFCNWTFACTLGEGGLFLFGMASLLFLPVSYELFRLFAVKRHYWIWAFIVYAIAVIAIGDLWGRFNPAYAGLTCSP